MRQFKTIDEQLDILKTRNLVINNEDKAKKYLLTNNYYNIINGYSKFFMNSNNTEYINNATFDEITNLYYFDKEIKYAFFKAITDAENHMKSILSYHFSETYPNVPYAYLNTTSYDQSKLLNLSWTISKLSKVINNNKKSKTLNSIKHYYQKHKDIPIWVIIDYLEFGDINSIIKNLPVSLQNKIAKSLTSFISENITITRPFTPELMVSFLDNIGQIRNVCAHNNRLIGFTYKYGAKHYNDLHSIYSIDKSFEKNDVYNTMLLLQCFLSKTQYAQLQNTVRKRMNTLDNKLKSININCIIKELGFPNNWHKTTSVLEQ